MRKYKRGERGLETLERQYLNSVKMTRTLDKLSDYFNANFTVPDFRPVYINKRLTKYLGLFNGPDIEVMDGMYKRTRRETLWHEMLHAVVYDNWQKVGKYTRDFNKVEKAVFQLEGNGSHHTQKYKLSCDCGWWIKTVEKQHKTYCTHCGKRIVSPNEYKKLKKISDINSRTVELNIDNYKPWKSNKKIGLDI